MSVSPDDEMVPFPEVVLAYYEEARLCWYQGAFVATIVMAQMAFEELLRNHYRAVRVTGLKFFDKPLDNTGFAELVKQAVHDGYLTPEEGKEIDKIRKNYRNPYVHVKDDKIVNGKQDLESPSWLTVGMKALCRNPYGEDASDEAKETIRILVSILPEICKRYGGF